jgi:hypothetical protein
VPAAQTALYPDHQFGDTQPGSVGFAWHEVEIEKVGTLVTWKMDGTTLITLETENFVTPTAGTNLLFGHSDINASVSTEAPYLEVAFTLIDNIKVEEIEVGLTGDHNGDGKVDAADYVLWRSDPASYGGDPQGYNDWVANFGAMSGSGGGSSAIGAVPEPGTLGVALVSMLLMGAGYRRRA